MEQKQYEEFIKSPEIQDMILSTQIGCIASEISKRLNIAPEVALDMFYESKTCANLHNKATGLYMLSNLYIVDEFMIEHNIDLSTNLRKPI